MKVNRLGLFAELHVEDFHKHRERHREIDVAFRNVLAESFGDKRHADQKQECKSEHLDRRMPLDEIADRFSEKHHRDDRYDNGRDHYPDGDSLFLAGGGIKGGFSYAPTDELCFSVVENKVHVHDLHATILHLLGFNHEKLTFRFQGRDFRLTDVHGHVVKDILA